MEILVAISNVLIFGLIVVLPFILLSILNKLKIRGVVIYYFVIGILLLVPIVSFSAWWFNWADLLLLKHYGYNIDGMNETEFYGKVLPENMQTVKNLQASIMGIGWTLKAIFGIVMIILYLVSVYIFIRVTEIFKKYNYEKK